MWLCRPERTDRALVYHRGLSRASHSVQVFAPRRGNQVVTEVVAKSGGPALEGWWKRPSRGSSCHGRLGLQGSLGYGQDQTKDSVGDDLSPNGRHLRDGLSLVYLSTGGQKAGLPAACGFGSLCADGVERLAADGQLRGHRRRDGLPSAQQVCDIRSDRQV